MRKIVFELCADTIEACIAARDGGADRIELCSDLSQGGLTPSYKLVRAAVALSDLPVHVMVRPRAGDFVYSEVEIAMMLEQILHLKTLGVAGVVFGMLNSDNTVDVERTRMFVDAARPRQATFHRAFDATPSLDAALEDVIETGCDRILTSGGQPDVEAGAASLAQLVIQARGRINVALGGGLRLDIAVLVAQLTKAQHFHGSLKSDWIAQAQSHHPLTETEAEALEADVVRRMVSLLRDSQDD